MRLPIRIWQWSWSKTYTTWNPSDKWAGITLSWWNLTAAANSGSWASCRTTISKNSWKWYFEIKLDAGSTFIGIGKNTATITSYLGSDSNWYGYYSNTGNKYNSSNAAYWATYTNGDVIGVALDMDWGTITMYKNNASQWVMYSSLSWYMFVICSGVISGWTTQVTANFGATTMTYTAPAGYNQWLYI